VHPTHAQSQHPQTTPTHPRSAPRLACLHVEVPLLRLMPSLLTSSCSDRAPALSLPWPYPWRHLPKGERGVRAAALTHMPSAMSAVPGFAAAGRALQKGVSRVAANGC